MEVGARIKDQGEMSSSSPDFSRLTTYPLTLNP